MQQTSLFSYAAIVSEPEQLNERQKKVYEAIKVLGLVSDKKIAQFLGWPINTVTPRRGELAKMGAIEKYGTDWDAATNRPVILWGVLR